MIRKRLLARSVRVFLFVLSAAPASAATHSVPAGGDLQAVLNAALPGDVIELEPGATYTGNFRLPVKDGADFIVVRTRGGNPALPPPGVRVDKSHAPLLAKIRSGNGSQALVTAPAAHHWRLELLEFQGNRNGTSDIISLGTGTQTDVSQQPHTFVLDRLYIHGDPVVGQKRGLSLNSGSTQVINSYFEDFKLVGQDTQALGGWNGTGPYLIENNYTEAAGENLIFGGADPSIPNLVPSDITIRRNVFTKPLSWRTERWQVKNAFELKNARRVLVEGNVFENVWEAAQTGFAVLFSVRNQNGRGPWTVVEDVTFRYNIIRHAGGAIKILGHDDIHPSQQTKRLRISHNLIYDIDSDRWGGLGIFVQMGAMPRDIYIEHNTVFHDGHVLALWGGKTPTGGHAIEGVVFRNNALRHNTYGVKGDSIATGNASINHFMPGAIFENNVLAGGRASLYPAANFFPSVGEFEAQYISPVGENYWLVPGSTFTTASSDGRALGADLGMMGAVMAGALTAPPPDAPGNEGDFGPPTSVVRSGGTVQQD